MYYSGFEIYGGKVVNYHQNPQNYHQLLKLVVIFNHHILPRIISLGSEIHTVLALQIYRRLRITGLKLALRITMNVNPLTTVNIKTVKIIT